MIYYLKNAFTGSISIKQELVRFAHNWNKLYKFRYIIYANFTAAPDTALYLHSIDLHSIIDVLSFIKTGKTEKALQTNL